MVESAGTYRIEGVLGVGGGGTVFAALAPDGTRVAVKVPNADSRLGAEWLLREASLAVRLRHPNIVALLGSGRLEDGRPYLVLEHVVGRSLELGADRLSTAEVVKLGEELLGALGYAHDAGVLHLDVSPSNVLIANPDRTAKLTDFGLAAPRDPRGSRRREVLVAGTPGYLSPEQALGAGGVGPRADVYGAGAVLYRLIAGFPPHIGGDTTEVLRRTLHSTPPPLVPRAGLSISPEACRLVDRMLSRGPEMRPATAFAARDEWLRSTRMPGATTIDPHRLTPAAPLRRPVSFHATEAQLPEKTRPARPSRFSDRPSLPPTSEVVGREDLVASIVEVATAGLVGIHGPPGVGKTSVANELARALNAKDIAVARVDARRGAPCPPFEPLATLALALIDPDDRRKPWPAAERLAKTLRNAGGADLNRGRDALVRGLFGAAQEADLGGASLEVYRALLLLRPRRALVLLVDDADSLDAASLGVLKSVAGEMGVVLVGEAIDTSVDTETSFAVEPLTFEHARALLGDTTDLRLPADLQLARWCGATDIASLDEALLGQLGRLGPRERVMLEVASLFRGDVPRRSLPAIASAVLREPVSEVGIDRLEQFGLLRPVRHASGRTEPWVRLAAPRLRALLSPEEDAVMATKAATWLARESFDTTHGVQAWIADLAERGGSVALAAYAAAEAGRRAAAVGDATADGLLERALEIDAPRDTIDRPTVLVELAERSLEHGTGDQAVLHTREALAELAHAGRPVLHARALRLQASAFSAMGQTDAAIQRLRNALTILEHCDDPMENALVLSSLGWELGYVAGDNEQGLLFGRHALRVAARIDAPRFRAHLCGRLGANQLRAGDWDGQLATNLTDLGLSIEGEDVRGVMRAHINIGVCYTNRGLLALARAHTQEGAELAHRHGALAAAHVAENNLAMIAGDEERWEDAIHHCDASRALAERRRARSFAETWAVIARTCHARGDTAGRDRACAEVVERARGAEAPLAARTRAIFLDPEPAERELVAALEQPIADPYERATTEFSLGLVRQRLGQVAPGLQAAITVLERLGANLELERRRWAFRPLPAT